MWAAAVNSRGGGNVRVSCKTLVIPPPVQVDISALSCRNFVRSQRDPILAQQGGKINERFPVAGSLLPPLYGRTIVQSEGLAHAARLTAGQRERWHVARCPTCDQSPLASGHGVTGLHFAAAAV